MAPQSAAAQAANHWARFFEIAQREASGRVQREKVSDVISIAARNRVRMGVHPDDVRSQLAGSKFGILYLQGVIVRKQYDAGINFASIVMRYMRIMGIPSPNPRSASLAGLIGGGSCDAPDDEEAVLRVRRAYNDMFEAVTEYAEGRQYMKALKDVILQDQACTDIGSLRCGLNLLAHLWR